MNDDARTNGIPFVPVARLGDIPVGEGRTYAVGDRLVAGFFAGFS